MVPRIAKMPEAAEELWSRSRKDAESVLRTVPQNGSSTDNKLNNEWTLGLYGLCRKGLTFEL